MSRLFQKKEIELARILQDDIPLTSTPFKDMGDKIGKSEKIVIQTIEQWKRSGIIRRMGALLRHQRAGFRANGMSVWNIKEEQIELAARTIVSFPQVGHCYQRRRFPGWPYNVYAMIHETSQENINKVADEISQQIQCSDYTILFTEREFKKTSMKYFVNEIPEETYEYNE